MEESRPARPARKRSARAKRREREVLDAAAAVFARKGYAATSVQEIADAVGLLKGSLYHYIESKDALLYRLVSEVHDAVERNLEEVAAIPGLSPRARIERYVERQVAYTLANLELIAVYHNDLQHLSRRRRARISARRRRQEEFIRALVVEGQRSGAADPALDPAIAANCVFAVLIWVYRWYRPGRDDPETLPRACASFATAALRPPA
jgi:AcrR family transcriptional regulator